MSAGAIVLHDGFKDWQFSLGADLDAGNLKFALLLASYTPDAEADVVWGDVSGFELSHVSYSVGGVALPSPSVSVVSGTGKLTSDDITINFLGDDTTAKWGLLYYDGVVGGTLPKPIVGHFDLETTLSTLPIPAGYEFLIEMPAAGWITWSQA